MTELITFSRGEIDDLARRIAPFFALADWRWAVRYGERVDPFVPDAIDLSRSLADLQATLVEEPTTIAVRGGRLMAERDADEGGADARVRFSLDLGTAFSEREKELSA